MYFAPPSASNPRVLIPLEYKKARKRSCLQAFQAGVCRGIALRFACPLGKLQMQFMPFPSNTKKTAVFCGNFPNRRPHGDCARGLVLLYKIRAVSALATLGSFCECKKPPSQAVASRHLRRRTQGFSSRRNTKKEVRFRKPLFKLAFVVGLHCASLALWVNCDCNLCHFRQT